ncbi:hypothetical protein QQS21_008613 [Conoideocrella luteorostrata]|uniref:Uncharacterized protein n=1 Tax=Conoideocrella luteorostrata TaxID=1105319 RepID=A0AAJ0FYJ0_9HYPO|nr:hypothetical protein QQS21_008613 [Conoideocrella luteorostrata]
MRDLDVSITSMLTRMASVKGVFAAMTKLKAYIQDFTEKIVARVLALPLEANLRNNAAYPMAPRPLAVPRQRIKHEDMIKGLQRQVAQLKDQNIALCQSIHEADNKNKALRKQISAYKHYIKKQDSGLARVIKTICLTFEEYQETVVEATQQASAAEVITE